jgi:hypothetical protein
MPLLRRWRLRRLSLARPEIGGRSTPAEGLCRGSRPSPAGNHKPIIGHFVGPGKPAFNQGFSQRHPIAPWRGQGAEIPCSEFSRPLRVRQLQHEGVDVHVPSQQGDQCQWRPEMDPKGWRLLERMQQVSERVTPGGRDSGVARPQVSRHGSIGVRFRMSI